MLAILSQSYKSPQVNVGMLFHKQEDWAKNPKHRAELDFQFLSTCLSFKKHQFCSGPQPCYPPKTQDSSLGFCALC